jgi:hypothetical protein
MTSTPPSAPGTLPRPPASETPPSTMAVTAVKS